MRYLAIALLFVATLSGCGYNETVDDLIYKHHALRDRVAQLEEKIDGLLNVLGYEYKWVEVPKPTENIYVWKVVKSAKENK